MKKNTKSAAQILEDVCNQKNTGWNFASKLELLLRFVDSRKEGLWLRKFLLKQAKIEEEESAPSV